MSVINVTKMWSRTGGSFESEMFDPAATRYGITEGYQVLTTPDTSIAEVESSPFLPNHGARHWSGIDAFVRSKSPEQLSPIFWMVIVGYQGVKFDESIEVEWTDTTTSEPIDRDFDGRAILTENDEPVEGLTMDISDTVVVIRRQFLSINTFSVADYRHATNSDTFLGWPPGTARLVGYSAKSQFKQNLPIENWDVTARIQFRIPLAGAVASEAWYKRWRHEGLYVLKDGVIQRARDDMGQEQSKPVLLKSDGTQETDPDNAVFKYTQVYGSLPYSVLGLV